jgi:hypothetical protein
MREAFTIEPITRLTRDICRQVIHREADERFPVGCNRCGEVGLNLFYLRGEILCFTHYERKRLGLR